MAAETRVAWFCEKHGVRHDWMVVMMPGAPHFCTKGCEKPMEPVMVLPVAEYNALMAREIDWERYNVLDNEVDRLRRLEAVVGDQLFFGGAPTQPDRGVLETAWRAARDGGGK